MATSKSNKIKKSFGSKFFDVANISILVLLAFTCFYPFWETFVVSFSSLKGYLSTNIHLWPTEWSFAGYEYMLTNSDLWTSYANSIFISTVGTAINVVVTVMAAYVLSKKFLRGQRILTFMAVFTMMFSGGLIPTYIVVKDFGLINSLWSVILPTTITTSYLIIMRNFFSDLPKELEESAMLDGCTEIGVLFKIILPISLPSILTITLFYAVDHWNEFFYAILYISDSSKYPLQLFLRSLLFESESTSSGDGLYLLGEPMKMAAVMMAIIPIMLVFPFFQKYFSRGVMTGAVKG